MFENSTRLPQNNRFPATLQLIPESVFENSTRFARTCSKIDHVT